jgi:hypothetical protein
VEARFQYLIKNYKLNSAVELGWSKLTLLQKNFILGQLADTDLEFWCKDKTDSHKNSGAVLRLIRLRQENEGKFPRTLPGIGATADGTPLPKYRAQSGSDSGYNSGMASEAEPGSLLIYHLGMKRMSTFCYQYEFKCI